MISDADIWRGLEVRIGIAAEAMGRDLMIEEEARIITDYAEDHDLPRERVVQVMVDRIMMAGGG